MQYYVFLNASNNNSNVKQAMWLDLDTGVPLHVWRLPLVEQDDDNCDLGAVGVNAHYFLIEAQGFVLGLI
jgi:hypothetical protein